MAFQQLIAKKIKLNGLMGIQYHMLDRDRVKTNPDIDLSRSHLNYFIENLTAENLNSRVKARIKQLNLKKHPRSDAVGLEDIVVKASAEFMLNADAETRGNYFTNALLLTSLRHHIHVGIIPITSNSDFPSKPFLLSAVLNAMPLTVKITSKLINSGSES